MRRPPIIHWLWGALTVVGAAIVIGFVVVESGAYDVAATRKDPGWLDAILNHTSDRSVAVHAKGVKVPANLGADSMQVLVGAAHYDGMCAQCHGAPGHDRGEVGKGLNPRPPKLDDAVDDLGNKRIFWIARHGIKMTGMPAFGPTHHDSTLWAVVAFIDRFPHMSGEQYEAWVAAARAAAP